MGLVVFLVPVLGVALAGWIRFARGERMPGPLRFLFVAVVASAAAGLTLGAGLRTAMLVAALQGGGTERTVGGTAFLLLAPALFLSPLGILLAAIRSALKARQLVLVPALGLVVLGLGSALLLGDEEIRQRGVFWVNQLTFGVSFFGYGAVFALVAGRLDAAITSRCAAALEAGLQRRQPRRRRGWRFRRARSAPL